jgi:hypothetical protein
MLDDSSRPTPPFTDDKILRGAVVSDRLQDKVRMGAAGIKVLPVVAMIQSGLREFARREAYGWIFSLNPGVLSG